MAGKIITTRQRRNLIVLSFVTLSFVLACRFIANRIENIGPAASSTGIVDAAPPSELESTTPATLSPDSLHTEEPAGAGDLEVVSVNGYLDSFDSWRVVGLVRNNSDQVVHDVGVQVDLLDAAGDLVYREIAFLAVVKLAPAEEAPFVLEVFESLPEAHDFVATVVRQSATEIERTEPEIVNSVMAIDDDADIHIVGEITNRSDRPLLINGLAVATFDDRGEIVTADAGSVYIQYLDPGDSGPFRATVFGTALIADQVADYAIYLDAEHTSALEPHPIQFSEHYDYLDSFEFFHLVGEVTNGADVPLKISLIAAIYDEAGNVIDADDLSLPFAALSPGEQVAYDFDSWGPLSHKSDWHDRATSYSVQIEPYWTWNPDQPLVALAVNGVEPIDISEYEATLTGTVLNDSGVTVNAITVVAGFRNVDTGQVVATGFEFIFQELSDGEILPYTVRIPTEPGLDFGVFEHVVVVRGGSS